MPDPISFYYIPPDLTCDGEPELSCDPPATSPIPAGPDFSLLTPAETNHCSLSAGSQLAIEYLRTDHSKLIAASAAPQQPADTAQAWFVGTHGPGA